MKIPPTRVLVFAAASLVFVWTVALTFRDQVIDNFRGSTSQPTPAAGQTTYNVTPTVTITDKAAVIIDTQYTPRLIPLILHYRAVLGQSWPIVFFTSQTTYDEHFSIDPNAVNISAIWRRTVAEGGIDVRIIPTKFDLTQREGVNIFLADRFVWEQLAPADKVLVFQADAMICGNSRYHLDDFLEFDFIGAMFRQSRHRYNGGLSLRNRNMMMDILNEGRNWKEESEAGTWKEGGEDVWFSELIEKRGGKMPEWEDARKFSLEYNWQVDMEKEPMGYHKVHKNTPDKIAEIRTWCPEIDLAAAGKLKG